mmetsp:Transcript_31530/g.50720  ORF Transcript_31530/g.50720 Transcript_31530/m.50720 type:complete len:116 (+) Transcript_31530:90-437(+)|eukprot:CAMPEP_0115150918 /NCGR_PEP_ID=MMETSP0227-20121206/65309_1 /TAXON_ID=89957 /ORGANISM="Polarella glacialis, Strain CCMP 1383" /LENGTH=115 /DNA_ID=CAMNT_0002561343 /DNA_START=81 /DNA_END=428 /DNA_ORIENTATION=+
MRRSRSCVLAGTLAVLGCCISFAPFGLAPAAAGGLFEGFGKRLDGVLGGSEVKKARQEARKIMDEARAEATVLQQKAKRSASTSEAKKAKEQALKSMKKAKDRSQQLLEQARKKR